MHIFFSVGEPSGDQHAAHLIQELRRRRPDLEFSAFGGPLMEEAGCHVHFRLTDLAVMGVFAVLPLLWKFVRLVRQAKAIFAESRPDAVVLVDFPGFNWWIARKAKAAGIPVFYYLPPQLWAWAPWRIRRVRRFVDHMLCALPFEKDWYSQRGVEVDYVGHPFFDEVADHPLNREFLDRYAGPGTRVVGILPGSRNAEVTQNWPVLLDVIRNLHGRRPQVRFLVANYKSSQREWCERQLQEQGGQLPVSFFVGKTPEIIEAAECCLMVSGSVSLEMLARNTPAVVVYRGGRVFGFLVKLLVTCKYASLPNLIANREVMPEFPFMGNPQPIIRQMTDIVDGWLSDPQQLAQAKAELSGLRLQYLKTGATARTADAILKKLQLPSSHRTAA